MKFTTLLCSLLLGAAMLTLTAGAPSSYPCKKPMVRKEWSVARLLLRSVLPPLT